MTSRRTFLGTTALLGTGLLAGCLGGDPPEGDGDGSGTDTDGPTSTPEPTPTEGSQTPPPDGDNGSDGAGGTRPEGTGGPAVTLASVAERPALPIRPTVELVEPVATADHPPSLRVRVENAADRAITVGEARAVAFEYVTSESGELITLPAGDDYPVEPDCWRLTEGVATTMEYRTATLAPGEALSSDLDLYGAAPGEDACLPVGEHEFRSTYTVSTGGDTTATGTADNGTTGSGNDGTDGNASAGDGTTNASATGSPITDPDQPDGATWGFTLLLE